jgi:DNA-binding CsgD family transcriptional regulator
MLRSLAEGKSLALIAKQLQRKEAAVSSRACFIKN